MTAYNDESWKRTPRAKYSVNARLPKYATEKGSRSFDMICFRSTHSGLGERRNSKAAKARTIPWTLKHRETTHEEERAHRERQHEFPRLERDFVQWDGLAFIFQWLMV